MTICTEHVHDFFFAKAQLAQLKLNWLHLDQLPNHGKMCWIPQKNCQGECIGLASDITFACSGLS